MPREPLRILNFDDTVALQKNLLDQYQHEIIDLREIGPRCRFWINSTNTQKLKTFLKPERKGAITFLGSGDFHHVSGLLIEQFTEPINVIIFDHHPDWDMLSPRLDYGSWVSYILRKKNIEKVILLGVSSNDISSFWAQKGNFNSLEHNRLEIYPYYHKPSRVLLRRIPENVSIRVKQGFFSNVIYWQSLMGADLKDFFLCLLSRFKTKKTYVSIDKDCLTSEYSLSNWEEGRLQLDELLFLLRLIRENLEILGLDVVGDYSLPKIHGWLKNFLSRIDHPQKYSAKLYSELAIRALNEKTNIKILDLLKG